MYKIEYSKDIEKDLSKLSKKEIFRILAKIDSLAKNPRPSRVVALQGDLKGLHRVRLGNYRIVYQILDERLVVFIVRVAQRGKVYKRT